MTCVATCVRLCSMATEPRIGTKIKRARERKRWTQRQLADALGVSRSAVNAWETDRAYPQSSLGALEDVLGISLGDEEPAEPGDETARLRREVEQLKAEARAWRELMAQELARRGKGNEDPEARAV